MMNISRLLLCSFALTLAACGNSDSPAGESAAEAPPQADGFPAYSATGRVEVSHGNDRATWYTTSNTVPGQEGREVHTASWVTMAGIGQSSPHMPNDIFVSLSARPAVQPDPDLPRLKVEFSLDPETLEAKDNVRVNASVESGIGMEGGTVENAVLALDRAEKVDENLLSLAGRISGELNGKPFGAAFEIDKAFSRSGKR